MTKFRKHLLIGFTALSLGAGSLAAFADGPGHRHGKGGGPMSSEDRARFEEHRKERAAKRQAELETALKLTPDQEPAWRAFTERMARTTPGTRPDRAEMAKLTAPERMERGLEMMKEREKRMGERLTALKEFYAVLTPDQQKIFDEQFNRRGRHHHRSAS